MAIRRMTAARKAALRKAQLASARKRKGRKRMSRDRKIAIAAGGIAIAAIAAGAGNHRRMGKKLKASQKRAASNGRRLTVMKMEKAATQRGMRQAASRHRRQMNSMKKKYSHRTR